MKKEINHIIGRYTAGEATLEETNAALKEAGSGVRLDPDRNALTAGEIEDGAAGLLDTGTGSYDKVAIVDGELKHAVNEVRADGELSMKAYVTVQGKTYEVFGKKLVPVEEA